MAWLLVVWTTDYLYNNIMLGVCTRVEMRMGCCLVVVVMVVVFLYERRGEDGMG